LNLNKSSFNFVSIIFERNLILAVSVKNKSLMKQLLLSFLVSFSSFVYSQQNGKEELNNASTPAMSPMINNSFGNYQHKEMSDSIDYPLEQNKSKERDAPLLKKEHSEKFIGYFAAFRTLLTVIEEF
jgi:hypothetical protein